MIVLEKVATIINTAPALARGFITRFLSQSIIASPKYGMEVSQECTLGEDLEKQKAARSKNGVVGTIGNNAPMKPKTTNIQPKTNKAVL